MEEQNKDLELEALKEVADEYGIKYAHTIGKETLAARIAEYESGVVSTPTPKSSIFNKTLREDTIPPEYEANKNVRVRISPLDPDKSSWQGDVITVGNSKGYIRKFILFDKDYHVPKAMLDVINEKMYTKIITKKNHLGHEVSKTVQSKAYNVELLSELTKEEFEAIKQNQLVHNKD